MVVGCYVTYASAIQDTPRGTVLIMGRRCADFDRWVNIRENPNSTFALITEIFGGITSNFHGLSQITALSKLPQVTPS